MLATLGILAVTQSTAMALQATSLELAHSFAPRDGRITALLAEKLSGAQTSIADHRAADHFAREALRQDATAVAASVALGINAAIRGDQVQTSQSFIYAERLSRRDLRTQLWGIETAVMRGDVNGALRHYDIALRTSREAPTLLFPILDSAIGNPAVRAGLIRHLAARPPWRQAYLDHAATSTVNPQAAMAIFVDGRRFGIIPSAADDALLIDSLLGSKNVEDAWRYYALVRRGARRDRSRDPDFTAALQRPTAFDWLTTVDAGLAASIQDGLVDFSAAPSVGGTALKQLLLLPQGNYRLRGVGRVGDQPTASLPYWRLACADGRELGRIFFAESGASSEPFSEEFTVPAGCATQVLSLVIQPSDRPSGVAGQVDRLLLSPAGSAGSTSAAPRDRMRAFNG